MYEKILIIDDDRSINKAVKKFFEIKKEYKVFSAITGAEGIRKFNTINPDIVLLDLHLPDTTGVSLVKKFKSLNSDIIIIVITGYGSIESAKELFKLGIIDYVLKPFKMEEIYRIILRELEIAKTKAENIKLKKEILNNYKPDNIIGESKQMKGVYKKIIQIAPYNINVLIEGESGTGKELVANAIHYSSNRKNLPLYPINCGAIPKELLESEIFGHKRGSFTGAIQDRKGIFEEATNSTIFLDEINEMPLEIQPKLLRVIQERKIKRIGDNIEKPIDVRIIAASSKNLQEEVKKNNFRKDLFYRINVFSIKLPPLRERKEDIPLLINHFIKKYSSIINKKIKGITDAALKKCIDYFWPGNVRELENIIQRAIVLSETDYINEDNIFFDNNFDFSEDNVEKLSYKEAVTNVIAKIDKIYIKNALIKSNYNKKKAAELLGISLRTLYYKLNKLDI